MYGFFSQSKRKNNDSISYDNARMREYFLFVMFRLDCLIIDNQPFTIEFDKSITLKKLFEEWNLVVFQKKFDFFFKKFAILKMNRIFALR